MGCQNSKVKPVPVLPQDDSLIMLKSLLKDSSIDIPKEERRIKGKSHLLVEREKDLQKKLLSSQSLGSRRRGLESHSFNESSQIKNPLAPPRTNHHFIENMRDTPRSYTNRDISTHSIVIQPGLRSKMTVTFGGCSGGNTGNLSKTSSKDASPLTFMNRSGYDRANQFTARKMICESGKSDINEASIKEEVSLSNSPNSHGHSDSEISMLSKQVESVIPSKKNKKDKRDTFGNIGSKDQIHTNSELRESESNNMNERQRVSALGNPSKPKPSIKQGSQTIRTIKTLRAPKTLGDVQIDDSVAMSLKSKRQNQTINDNSVCFGDERSYGEFYSKLKGKVSRGKYDSGNLLDNLTSQKSILKNRPAESSDRDSEKYPSQSMFRRQSTTGGNCIPGNKVFDLKNAGARDATGQSIASQLKALEEQGVVNSGDPAVKLNLFTGKDSMADLNASEDKSKVIRKRRKLTSHLVVDSTKKEAKEKSKHLATKLEPIMSESPVIPKRSLVKESPAGKLKNNLDSDDSEEGENRLRFNQRIGHKNQPQAPFSLKVNSVLKNYVNPSNFTFQKDSERVDTSKAELTVGQEGSQFQKGKLEDGKKAAGESIHSGFDSPRVGNTQEQSDVFRSPCRSFSMIGRLSSVNTLGNVVGMSHMDKRILARANRLAKREKQEKVSSIDDGLKEEETQRKSPHPIKLQVPVICTGGKNT